MGARALRFFEFPSTKKRNCFVSLSTGKITFLMLLQLIGVGLFTGFVMRLQMELLNERRENSEGRLRENEFERGQLEDL